MTEFRVNKKQSLVDVCLQVYGTTQQLFKLAKDNGLQIDSVISVGDVLTYDPAFGDFLALKKINSRGLSMVNPGVEWVAPVPLPLAEYGRLYNYYAANDANFLPSSIHIPSEAEWNTLATYLGGISVAGGKLKEAGLTHWLTPNTGADNSTGFTGLGAGARFSSFGALKDTLYIWTSEDLTTLGRSAKMNYNGANTQVVNAFKYWGLSVRGVTTVDPGPTVTDFEGRIYDVVQIGTQYWTVQNWACAFLNDGTPIPNVTDNAAWAALTTMGQCAYDNNDTYIPLI